MLPAEREPIQALALAADAAEFSTHPVEDGAGDVALATRRRVTDEVHLRVPTRTRVLRRLDPRPLLRRRTRGRWPRVTSSG